MLNRRPALALLCSLALVAAAAGQPAPKGAPAAPRFRLKCEARMITTSDGEQQKLDADTTFEYSWKRDGNVRILVLESVSLNMAVDGQETMNTRMSRAGVFGTQAGRRIDKKLEDAPEDKQKFLTDLFGSPICKIEMDESGKEIKRTIVAGRAAVPVLATGLIANSTFFHPWFSSEDEWRIDQEISSAENLAKGPVTYKKTPGGKAGLQVVKVTGTLTADGGRDSDGHMVKDSKFTVAGEQTYDTTRKEWVAGKLTMDMAFKVTRNEKEVGSAKGAMTMTFKLLPDRK
jgi:hypothetical protein